MQISESKLRNIVRQEIDKVISEVSTSDQVEHYVDKFFMKMAGSTLDTAKRWVDGIGTVSRKTREKIWKKIKDRGRVAKHHDGTKKIYRPER